MKRKTTRQSPNYFYPKKVKPVNFSSDRMAKDSMNLARTGVGLAFAGLTLGIATKAFKNAFD